MDISRASNFERFVYDLVGRDSHIVTQLWRQFEGAGEIDFAATPFFARVGAFGFISARSTHADRLATIREIDRRYGVVIDPHTADGVKVGLALREQGVPLICAETALPAKFESTIQAALGRRPARPQRYEDLESRPQRCEVIDANADAVKAYIARHAG